MKNNKIFNKKHIFFVGIGGISMSALAKYSITNGAKVSGSDRENSEIVQNLIDLGCQINTPHSENNITNDIDLMVYTSCITDNNPEIIQAKLLHIPLISRADFLNLISSQFSNVIAISGTHGKTSTTTLIGDIFSTVKNPTIHIGGICNRLNTNIQLGSDDIFITEACEYKKSFVGLNPNLAIILNTELDHTDYYKNIEQIEKAYIEFSQNSQTVLLYENFEFASKLKNNLIYICGFDKRCDFYAYNLQKKDGYQIFDLKFENKYIGFFKINQLGDYAVKNAIIAIATALLNDIPYIYIYNSCKQFLGVKRRMQIIKKYPNNCRVICDYAHHPTEILNSIKAVKQVYKKVCVIFQPHTYSRTKTLLNDFVKCFKKADNIAIYPTYPAREEYDKLGSAEYLFAKIKKKNKTLLLTKNQLINFISDNYTKYNAILVLGAGDIYDIVSKQI